MMSRVRRTTELGLIILGALIVVAAYTLASLGSDAVIPANLLPFLGIVLGLLLFAHLATRRLAPFADGLLLPLAALLNGIGYVMIARLAGERGVSGDLPGLQATWTALGIAAYVGTLLFVPRVRDLQRYRYSIGVVGIVLLLLPLFPIIGRNIFGARIWISIGPVNLQPGEFAKIALAIFFAGYLVEKRDLLRVATWRIGPLWLPEPKHLGPVVVAWGFSLVVMVFERDLGSSLLFFALFVVLIWIATERISYLIISLVLFTGGAVAAWSTFGHVKTRVNIWRNPWDSYLGEGRQLTESSFALADGGLTGTGLGLGTPERIDVVESDFIFAAIGEELGLLGGTAVILCYLLFAGSGLRIAVRAEGAFEKLLAVGLTTLMAVQAFVIIGGIIRIVPLTGITLPFVSYGGSSLLSNYVLLALLVRTSHEAETRTVQSTAHAVPAA
ncbi:MAG: FtsW/RodA/SpoVE family cell cycle protein [Acidimicrobiales bacterium]|nr:FtsW/RodA/SpoVE family cell cycle protein [Acidimicrobiales bacterium]